MKRHNPNPNYDSSVTDDNNRVRRRRRPTEDDDAVRTNLRRRNSSDHALSASGKGQGPTASIHSIEHIGENVYLPDYVREHNSTLTFPEKVRCFIVVFILTLCGCTKMPLIIISFFIVDANSNAC